jgi:hypothetical protein
MALLTAAQVRSRISRGGVALDANQFDDDWVDEAVADFESLVLKYRGEVATTATVTETVRTVGVADRLVLRWPVVTSVTSVTVSGTAVSSSLYYVEHGMVVRTTGSFYEDTPATVVYVHGFGSPVAAKKGCALYVEKLAALERGGSTRDMSAQGDFTSYIQPDWAKKRPTGWVDVDRYLNQLADYRIPGVG